MTKYSPEEASKIVGPSNVSTTDAILERYSGSFGPYEDGIPSGIIWPSSREEILKIMSWANQKSVPLVPVSSGPPFIRGDSAPKIENTIILDVSRMNKILRIDRRNKVVMIEPGVTYGTLLKEAKKEGLLPLMPLLPKENKSVLAANLDREPIIIPRFHWDSSDPLLCTEIIFGTGDLFRTGAAAGPGSIEEQWASGQAQKNPMGPSQFDPYKIIQGSQGTIGVVTWITMKCETIPDFHNVYLAGGDDIRDFQNLSYILLKRRLPEEHLILNSTALATALKFTPSEINQLKEQMPSWILVIGVAGRGILAEDEFNYRLEDTMEIANQNQVALLDKIGTIKSSDIAEILNTPCKSPYWKLRLKGGCREILFTSTLDKVPDLVDVFIKEAERVGYPTNEISVYIQPIVHGTSTHCSLDIYFDPANSAEAELVNQLQISGSKRLLEAGAFFSRPYGPFTDTVFEHTSSEIRSAMWHVKDIFDPSHILNPGTLCFKEGSK